jgi:hypothetical protein
MAPRARILDLLPVSIAAFLRAGRLLQGTQMRSGRPGTLKHRETARLRAFWRNCRGILELLDYPGDGWQIPLLRAVAKHSFPVDPTPPMRATPPARYPSGSGNFR